MLRRLCFVVCVCDVEDWCDESTCRFGGVCVFDADGFRRCVCQFHCRDDR